MSPLDENKDYFLALQHMIEEMAEKAGGPVVLIAHSMGNMYTLYFLNQQPQAWKDKYIKAFICLGAPWAGVAKTLRVVISGKEDSSPLHLFPPHSYCNGENRTVWPETEERRTFLGCEDGNEQ